METKVTQAGERRVSATVIVALVLATLFVGVASLFGAAVLAVPLILGGLPVAIFLWFVFHRRYEYGT